MAFQHLLQGSLKNNYRRLINTDCENAKAKRRWQRRAGGGRVFCLKLSSFRRLRWRPFYPARRIADLCSDIKSRVKENVELVPSLVSYSQWGILILSNPSGFQRKTSVAF
ncbi:hypothetical protein KSP39_PZI016339 [Platanthera zijinensis]|uniref:Uncharacterized protein n=1 Tax=Platanthera zijinensis TaxID=2320716 RepID=A0AAP0B7J7_9ASPA